MSNLEIIFRDWLDALRRGDLETISARLAADVVHEGVRPELICSGRAAVLARIRRLVTRPPEITALELIEIDDRSVLPVRAPTVGVPADEQAGPRGQAIIVFTLRDETTVHMQDYLTRTAALDAVNVTGDPWH